MSGEGLITFLVGAPFFVLAGTVLGGYVAHRYSPTYVATGLGAVGGGVATTLALPLVVIPLMINVMKTDIPKAVASGQNGSKTSPPSPPSL